MIDTGTALAIGTTAAISATAGALVRGAFHQRTEALEALMREKILRVLASSPLAQDVLEVGREVRELREDIKACRLRREELTEVRKMLEERAAS